MVKTNCWEYKKCGRELGGANSLELGVCPAAIEKRTNGVHDGKNGGRVCWAVSGTLCGGKVQGTFALKMGSCMKCDFYTLVVSEEGVNRKSSSDILKLLKA